MMMDLVSDYTTPALETPNEIWGESMSREFALERVGFYNNPVTIAAAGIHHRRNSKSAFG
jgi:hypothetical protein